MPNETKVHPSDRPPSRLSQLLTSRIDLKAEEELKDPTLKRTSTFSPSRFQDDDLEKLYSQYIAITKSPLSVSIILLILNVSLLIRSEIWNWSDNHVIILSVVIVMVFINLTSLAIFYYFRNLRFFSFILYPYIVWILLVVQTAISTAYTEPFNLAYVTLSLYSIYIGLPFKIVSCLITSLITCLVHALIFYLTKNGDYPKLQSVVSTLLIYAVVCASSILVFFASEASQRKAFIETKKSLSANLLIEEAAKEQERLLLSVLPKHVAEEMVKDLGITVDSQFRKIYMNRHEDVSILFADIVGFTALSSRVSASELIKILNDLFATFDKLAHKYHQLRIKILGDCYYCIAGCPVPRSDHAVLCVHMGLDMVVAIAEVRKKTQSGVNMRVGIHTGAILGGVLGQHRWQYDILGKDVTLANKMESGGLPGRVHVSQATATFLKKEFELENGDGESREEELKRENVKTFLVKSVLKKFPKGTLDDVKQSGKNKNETSVNETTIIESNPSSNQELSFAKIVDALQDREWKINIFKKLKPIFQFKDNKLETSYIHSKYFHNSLISISSPLILTVITITVLLLSEEKLLFSVLHGASLIILISMVTLNFSCVVNKRFPKKVVEIGRRFFFGRWFSQFWNGTMTLLLAWPSVFILAKNSGAKVPYAISNCILIFFATALLPLLNVPWKILISFSLCAIFCSLARSTESAVILISSFLCFSVLSIKYDLTLRKFFIHRMEVDEARSQIDEMKIKNESLIYNILPHHVAKDFVGSNRTEDELYSHAYEEVGVIFAACPNFNDFYTEDSVNNNGLECIRLLNEILSDYDVLLTSEPRFESVIKIKTINSTYMAASGLNITNDAERWKHLADLIEFAKQMKIVLDRVNSQSFNNFMLRVGLNHGPVLAGVIGVTKPHYDIWGNTVNVASRMESTGQMGKIQVVEETAKILEKFGYQFEARGLVRVKGKGELKTFFLID